MKNEWILLFIVFCSCCYIASPNSGLNPFTHNPDACEPACKKLSALGCAEGSDSCVELCLKVETNLHFPPEAECVSQATSKETLKNCPIPVRCK